MALWRGFVFMIFLFGFFHQVCAVGRRSYLCFLKTT